MCFDGHSGNTRADVTIDDIIGVEKRREPIDWGFVMVSLASWIGTMSGIILGIVTSQTDLPAILTAGCGIVAVVLLAVALDRNKVVTIRTANTAYNFQKTESNTANKLANAVAHYS